MRPATAAHRILRLLFGRTRQLQRMLRYWVATALVFLVCLAIVLVQIRVGVMARADALPLIIYGASGVMVCYLLVRFSDRLRITPRMLSVLQGLFWVSCDLWLYAISGPLRSASLVLLLVVIAFCTFAMHPRQTLLLSAIALVSLAALMLWLVNSDPAHFPATIESLSFAFFATGLLTVTALTGEMNKLRARLKSQKQDLLRAVDTIRTLATIDELTSLANRRYMNEILEREQRRTGHHGTTCIALLDIDFFKRVNDGHGHAAGDAVLRAFAGAARAELRATDVLARWGGEEFLLLLPSTNLAEAQVVLARMALRVAAMTVPDFAGLAAVSFSAGVAARHDNEDFADTVQRADRALYASKTAGRNRVTMA